MVRRKPALINMMRRNVLTGEKVDNISKKYRMKNKKVASLALFYRKEARGMRRKNQTAVSHTCEDLHFRGHAREFAFSATLMTYSEFRKRRGLFCVSIEEYQLIFTVHNSVCELISSSLERRETFPLTLMETSKHYS